MGSNQQNYHAYPAGPYAPPPRKRRWPILLLAALLLLALAVGGYFFWQSLDRDRDDGDDEDEVVESRAPKDEEDAAETPEPEPTPTPEPPQITLLHDMGYLGDAAACRMTAEQARAISGVISQTQGGVVMAAIFDGGDGVPILWVAKADTRKNAAGEDKIVLTGSYADKVYGFENGALRELTWITNVLRPGTDGVVCKVNRDATKIEFFRLHNGLPDAQPFGVGVWDHSGTATYNGTEIGSGEEIALWDFYRLADAGLDVLLEAMSGDSANLYLTGTWLEGGEMCTLLEQYAASVS